MSFWQMFFSVGSFIAYWINFACARNRTNLGHWDWKMVSSSNLEFPELSSITPTAFRPDSSVALIP